MALFSLMQWLPLRLVARQTLSVQVTRPASTVCAPIPVALGIPVANWPLVEQKITDQCVIVPLVLLVIPTSDVNQVSFVILY